MTSVIATLLASLGLLLLAVFRRRLLGYARESRLALRLMLWAFLGGTVLVCTLILWLGIPRTLCHLVPQPEAAAFDLAEGVHYKRLVSQEPARTVHVVSLDLGRPGLRFIVREADAQGSLSAQTTSQFLEQTGADLAINGAFFEPWSNRVFTWFPHEGDLAKPLGYYRPRALAAQDATPPSAGTLYLSADGAAASARIGGEPPNESMLAITGERILRAGKFDGFCESPFEFGSKQAFTPHPRTVVGLSADRQTLWFVVADGRQQRRSEGARLPELCELLLAEGAADAINLDGGGSSTLVQRGKDGPEVMNHPVHRRWPGRERPIPSHIGVVF